MQGIQEYNNYFNSINRIEVKENKEVLEGAAGNLQSLTNSSASIFQSLRKALIFRMMENNLLNTDDTMLTKYTSDLREESAKRPERVILHVFTNTEQEERTPWRVCVLRQ